MFQAPMGHPRHCYQVLGMLAGGGWRPTGYVDFMMTSATEVKVNYVTEGACRTVYSDAGGRTYYR